MNGKMEKDKDKNLGIEMRFEGQIQARQRRYEKNYNSIFLMCKANIKYNTNSQSYLKTLYAPPVPPQILCIIVQKKL